MKPYELRTGRVFVLRLETGEVLHEAIEGFSKEKSIKSALITAVGGVATGSKMVVGPNLDDGSVVPIVYELRTPHELTATGTVFCDENDQPVMHMHGSVGYNGHSTTGCLRAGMIAWLVLEVTITELLGDHPKRIKDGSTGFLLLES